MTLLVSGLYSDGLTQVPIKVAADGTVVTSGGGGGGGGGTSDTTEATQLLVKTAVEAINTKTGNVTASPTANTVLGRLKDISDAVAAAATTALAAGTALIGKVGIDQTTPGTSDAVTVKSTGSFAPVSRSVSTAYEAGRVASASAATFYGISGYNSSTSAIFVQIHNASSAPADTAVPVEIIYVPATSSFAFEAACQQGDAYSTGIYVCGSTTGPTKTIDGAVLWLNVRYR